MNKDIRTSVQIICLLLMCMCFAFAKAETLPPCAVLVSPIDGATNVPVESTISWTPETGVFGYSISLGTTMGGTDIASDVAVGATPSYTPPLGLPESTLIYVTITVIVDQTNSIVCDEQSFTTLNVTTIPDCTQLTFPSDGATDVTVDPILQWSYASRATGYVVNMGTTPGASDVINNQDVGNVLNFNIPFSLIGSTTYYVTITPYNENGQTVSCAETSFTTEFVANEPPACTNLFTPEDGAVDIALTPLLQWNPVPTADGYLLTVGTSPMATDVLDMADLGNNTSTLVLDFDEGITYYVIVTPYNAAGAAINCPQTSFTTTLGCGPYFDVLTNTTVDLNPQIDLEDTYGICIGGEPLELLHTGIGDTFDWVKIVNGQEQSLSTGPGVVITEGGSYRFDVSVEAAIEAGFITCDASHEFTVTTSEAAIIESLNFQNQGLNASVNVQVSGVGDYEYAIGSMDETYQDSPVFSNVPFTNIQVFVRDKNGCGIVASQKINPDLGFPKYFTPNSDGINDYWQVRGVMVNGERIRRITVFDRYGKKIKKFSPFGQGWDGTFNGNRMLDTNFWYYATTDSNTVFTGYFALRR